MNIALTGNSISFTEHHNLPYGIILGFISFWNIVINTNYSVWGSSSVFIIKRSLVIHTKTMIRHKVLHI